MEEGPYTRMSQGMPSGDTASADVADYPTAIFAVCGFAAYLAALFALLFSTAFAPVADEPFEGFVYRAILLSGFAAVQLLSHTGLPNYIDTAHRRSSLRVLALALALLLGLFTLLYRGPFPAAPVIQGVIWMLLGMALGEMLVFWGVVWNGIDAQSDRSSFCSQVVAASVLLAAGACAAMVFAPRIACLAVALILLAASVVLQHLCGRRIPPTEDISTAVSRKRLDLRGATMFVPGAASFAFGVALALNGLRLGADAAFVVTLAGIAAGAIAMLAAIALKGSSPSASGVERVVFPLLSACLLLLPFMAVQAAFQAVMVLLVGTLTAYLISHWNILVMLAYRRHLKPIYHFGQGLIAVSVGIALGWGVVAAAFVLGGSRLAGYTAAGWNEGFAPGLITGSVATLTLAACLIAVFVIVLALSIVPYASNTVVESLFPSGSRPPRSSREDLWDDACSRICRDAALTPRECEVFAYLARGRNAEHIAGELIISIHTVKTHTARIYRKLGINSQQQLLDQVEARAAAGNPVQPPEIRQP